MSLPAADVDVLGTGQLIMRTMEPGDAKRPKPIKGDVVELKVIKMLVNDRDHPCPAVRRFRLGDGDECDAFELVTQRMHPKETCAIKSLPAVCGLEHALCKAQPAADVTMMVKLLQVLRLPAVTELPLIERIAESKRKKERGNWLFGREEFEAAGFSFRLGVSYIAEACHKQAAAQRDAGSIDHESVGDVPKEAAPLCCSLYTNLALVQLKLEKNLDDAVAACNGALDLQPGNVKALYLRAKSLLTSDPVSEAVRKDAVETLNCALVLEPDNEQAQALLKTVHENKTEETVERGWKSKMLYFVVVNGVLLAAMPPFFRMVMSDARGVMMWITGNSSEMLIATDAGVMLGDDVTVT